MPWTAVGSTGVVDQDSVRNQRYAFTDASLGYELGSNDIGPILARYNVTNVGGNNTPGWAVLELGATAPGPSAVRATLYRVDRCTGVQHELCFAEKANDDSRDCTNCQFPRGAINFEANLYYVLVQLKRSDPDPNVDPRVHTLRLL